MWDSSESDPINLFLRYSLSSKSTDRPASYSIDTLTLTAVNYPTYSRVKATLFSNPLGFSGNSIFLTKAIFLNVIDNFSK